MGIILRLFREADPIVMKSKQFNHTVILTERIPPNKAKSMSEESPSRQAGMKETHRD